MALKNRISLLQKTTSIGSSITPSVNNFVFFTLKDRINNNCVIEVAFVPILAFLGQTDPIF